MANENNDISDIVKKCKILLLDIEGTTTSISFVKDKLFPYAEENVKEFLDSQWESDDVKEAVAALRKLAIEDKENAVDGVVTIPGEDASKEDQIEGLVKSVKWQMSSDRKVGALKQLQGLVWKQGYDKGDIKGHVFDDVSPALELWRSGEDHKVYIYSSGSVQAQKLLFGQSAAGDLLPLIDGHFDTAIGAKQEAASYAAISEKIGVKPDEILFLTDILKEAEAARKSGVQAALVSREGNAPLPDGAASFPLIYSLAQLANTNKRKPDPQDEQPAKVPKTDLDDDVKTNSDTEKSTEIVAEKVTEEPQKMEVEEESDTKEEAVKPAEMKGTESEKVETIVEEVTDVNAVVDTPVCDVEPIIEESVDKTEHEKTEKMDTESSEPVGSVSEAKDEATVQNTEKAPVAKETPPTVITEISDITNDKESLSEVAEIIEDLEPVVEEPPAVQDMEELQNVGEVLEKECDEILSKVQDVTNLDNIPLKPLLNPIAEETMETDNTDSNDIVDKILDSELELEMKQCGDIDLNTVETVSEPKAVAEEGKGDNPETDTVAEEKSNEKEEDKVTEKDKATNKEHEEVKEKTEEKEIVKIEEKECIKAQDTVEKIKETTDKVKDKVETVTTESIVEEVKAMEENHKETSSTEEAEKSKIAPVVNEIEKVEQKKEEEKVEIEQNIEKEESKTETKENNLKMDTEEETSGMVEADVSEKTEVSKVDKEKSEVKDEVTVATVESKAETSDSKGETENTTEKQVDAKESQMETDQSHEETKETPAAQSTMETDAPAESKEAENTAEEVKMDSETTETRVNGKATNGEEKIVNVNGEASKDDELSSRLSIGNVKEVVNGANGDATDADQGQGESADADVADIKVKTVATEEPRTDPIEQPTEA